MVRTNRPKIFITEDNVDIAEDLRNYLEKFSISSRVFCSGIDFLREVDEGLDLAILDVNLSSMDGFQTLIELKRRHPHIMIIVVSGENIDHNRMEALECGADYFLPKPIDLDVLENILIENFGIKLNRKNCNGEYYA
ncbi:MAG: response regulator [Candidatus Zixiibacteriota bacterium]